MRLQISKTKNASSFYIVKSIYENKKRSSKVVEKLGTLEDVIVKANGEDPYEWAKKRAIELTEKENKSTREVLVKYSQTESIPKDERREFKGGYLFLEKIYYSLGLHNVCNEINEKYKHEFDFNSILKTLVFGRILSPSSKLSTFNFSKTLLEPQSFELQHVYRALDIISKESDFIQSKLYEGSKNVIKRNTNILYYDCTNFFFEIEEEDGLKQYGMSKEHRPNPLVQMGLFMDSNGIPLAFNMTSGNTNEQVTLKPLEEKIISDFNLSKFIVCTDAGLASNANKKFNIQGERSYITTQPLKKLKSHLRKWALDSSGFSLPGDSALYDMSNVDEALYKDKTFYKERWINENGLEERLIVTYSIKYKNYQRQIRNAQIQRAEKAISKGGTKPTKKRKNDYKRLIASVPVTPDGEIAEKIIYSLDKEIIAKEEAFDGFYGVSTNLDDDVAGIIKVNHRRWEIEESFRIMKSEFKARPVYLSRDERIVAHFNTCFLALTVFRILEKKLKEKYTCEEIVHTLRGMNFFKLKGEGFTPIYTRTDLTDALHDAFSFRTDYEIITEKNMKKLFKGAKI